MNDAQGTAAQSAAAEPPGIVNVANVLTVVRIFLVPVFVLCLVNGGTAWRYASIVAFLGASVTDYLDGQLARKRGLVTDFGKIADPIADKALTGAALITLSALGELSGWVTGLILVREVGITAMRFAVIRRGVIAASKGGKLKTLLQIVAISLYLLPPSVGLPPLVKQVVMGAALAVTLVSGVDYVVRAVRMKQPPPDEALGAPVSDEAVTVRGDEHSLPLPEDDRWQMASQARKPVSWPPRSSGCLPGPVRPWPPRSRSPAASSPPR